jgi:nucleobase:cation symporter-1, NCS1 family
LQVESHSIDFVPLSERYGTPRRLFTVWFSCNLTILGVALGTLGIRSGLSFGWTVAALILGNALGTIFMAAHSAQGPQLGVPQMIQSRAQFGVQGAALPLVAVVITYILYCAANGVLIQSVLSALLPITPRTALVLFSVVTALIAFVGYELIHRLGAATSLMSSILFAGAAVLLIVGQPAALAEHVDKVPHFTRAAFTLTTTQAAAWGLSYGPYVADYSRYLPADTSPSRTFWYTAMGCFLGSVAIMAFGAYLATVRPELAKDPGLGVAKLFGPLGPLAELLIVFGVMQGNVLNLYSAYMSSVTVFSGFHGMKLVERSRKLFILIALVATAGLIAAWADNNFEAYFADALNGMVYMLVPWSAINLADYYLVRDGHYQIPDLYRREGEYGAYRWKTLAVYCLGIAVQVPFMDLSFYHGVIAQMVGADLAWLPGLIVPGILHVVAERRT